MADTGSTMPTAASDNAAVGTVAWSAPSNILTENFTNANLVGNKTSHFLEATTYGFAVPAGATIKGIVLKIIRRSGGFTVLDNIVSLVKGGTVSGDNKNDPNPWATSAEETITYGSSTDLWGLTLLPADVNASDFGAVVSATNGSANVRSMRITVYYDQFAPMPTFHRL